jgi:hypothetical protein
MTRTSDQPQISSDRPACLLTSPPVSHKALTIMFPNNPRLPLELQQSILSHLAHDLDSKSCRPTLANCALVCHAWCSIVQPWMFTELRYTSAIARRTQLNNTVKFFGASSPSHHLSKHIKMITISPMFYSNTIDSFQALLRAMNEREMFQLFNNVEFIVLNPGLYSLVEADIALLSQFRQLAKMQLTCSLVFSFPDLVSSFPALTHLGLSDVPIADSGSAHVQALKLQRLGIFLNHNDDRGFPPGIELNAPGLEYLILMWSYHLSTTHAASFVRNVITSIPSENIKTLNLIGQTWDATGTNVILGKS